MLLFRQVNPSWVDDDGVTSQAFIPFPKDNGLLSVYNDEKFTAEASFDHFTAQGFRSIGTLGVSRDECAQHSVPCNLDNDPFEGHASLDYNGFDKSTKRTVSKLLRHHAVQRGWLHEAPTDIEGAG